MNILESIGLTCVIFTSLLGVAGILGVLYVGQKTLRERLQVGTIQPDVRETTLGEQVHIIGISRTQ